MSSNTRRALVADDEDSIVFLLSSLLGIEGFEVDCAADGDEASELTHGDFAHDLVCIDVSMPGRDSLELVREVRAQRPGTAILVLSGRTDDGPRAIAAGATAFIPKPFATSEFRRLARSLAAPVA